MYQFNSWRLVASTALLPSAGVAIGQYAPTTYWVMAMAAAVSIINVWLWFSEMREVESRARLRKHISDWVSREISRDQHGG